MSSDAPREMFHVTDGAQSPRAAKSQQLADLLIGVRMTSQVVRSRITMHNKAKNGHPQSS